MYAIITLGLPLSGKTTEIKKRINSGILDAYEFISADEMKENHPDYDPNDAEPLHEWSVSEAEKTIDSCIALKTSFVFDSGSINNRYTIRIMNKLIEADFRIHLIYVKTPYTVCLERNKKRTRKVPEKAITDKALKEVSQFHKLKKLADLVTIVDYFTYEHIFVDMDGVLAAQSTLPIINGKIDFVNGEIHKWQAPVQPVIDKLNLLKLAGKKIHILSATPNSFSTEEKNKWLDEYFNIPKEDRYFVNQGRHKAEMLDNLRRRMKLDHSQVVLVDDVHSTLTTVAELGMRPMHISEFLTHKF